VWIGRAVQCDRHPLDAGFPTQINNYKIETPVVDRDSTGTAWPALAAEDDKIYANHTTGANDTSGTPFVIPGGE
jgi:hypothetical protein